MSDSTKLLKEAKRYSNHLFQHGESQAHEVVDRLLKHALKLEARNKELEEAGKILVDFIELADETGYVDDVGFVNIDEQIKLFKGNKQ